MYHYLRFTLRLNEFPQDYTESDVTSYYILTRYYTTPPISNALSSLLSFHGDVKLTFDCSR